MAYGFDFAPFQLPDLLGSVRRRRQPDLYFDSDTEGSGNQDAGVQQYGAPEQEPLGRPRGSFLDTVASRLGDLGYGGGEEAKRVALRRALGAVGARLVAGSTKEGFGALAPAVSGGFGAYRGELEDLEKGRKEDAALKLKQDQADLQARYTGALTRQAEEGVLSKEEKAAQARAVIEERKALVARQRAAIATRSEAEKSRLEPLVGTPDFEAGWLKITEDPKPIKPEEFSLSQGEDRYRVGADGKPVLIASRPPAPRVGREKTTSSKPLFRQVNGTTMMWDPDTEQFVDAPGGTVADPSLAEAHKIYADAIRSDDHPLRVKGKDGALDVRGTWNKALEAARATLPQAPPPDPKTAPVAADSPAGRARAAKAGPAPPPVAPPTPAHVAAVREGLKKEGAIKVRRRLLAIGKSPAEVDLLLRLAAGG